MEKAVFDKLVIEFNELNDKISKLKEFIVNKDKFEQLDNLNKDLLIAQLRAMETYITILSIRLSLNVVRDDNQVCETQSEA